MLIMVHDHVHSSFYCKLQMCRLLDDLSITSCYELCCSSGVFVYESNIPALWYCRCVFESWRCDGQVDCKDGTDELNCTVTLPRKVITAATVGSLVCGLLLVIAMGCTCKLYSLRTREYR